MLSVLANRTYRHLLLAQVVALLGTGLLTVALSLLAFRLAGSDAGAVLGTALAIKMIAYVGIAPVASAFTERMPRRTLLVALDLARAAVALLLPFVTQIWQIYLLIFVLQAASAAFTPTFQATIPDVLPDERDYTRALSLSRLAYDLESLVSPALAAALLTVISYNNLFVGTVVGFLASATLVLSVTLPSPRATVSRGIWARTTRGMRLYLATPRLRGLLALNLAVAAGGALVFVNTVVFVQGIFGLGERQVAMALAAFGGGSMLVALALPRLLDQLPDRPVMLSGAALMAAATALASLLTSFGRAPAALVCARHWLQPGPDPFRPPAAPFGAPRGPAGDLRRPIRALPRLLADRLPSGRLVRCASGPACDRADPLRDGGGWHCDRDVRLAGGGGRGCCARPSGTGP